MSFDLSFYIGLWRASPGRPSFRHNVSLALLSVYNTGWVPSSVYRLGVPWIVKREPFWIRESSLGTERNNLVTDIAKLPKVYAWSLIWGYFTAIIFKRRICLSNAIHTSRAPIHSNSEALAWIQATWSWLMSLFVSARLKLRMKGYQFS